MKGLHLLMALLVAVVCIDVARATNKKRKNCPHECGFGAHCDKKEQKCVCRSKREGDPNFLCYASDFYHSCQISSDPMLTTTDKQSAGIKMPASLSLSEITTRRFGSGRGTCVLTLDGWTKRFEGKYFIKGFDLNISQNIKKGKGITLTTKLRIVSEVVDNKYIWTVYEWEQNNWKQIVEITSSTKSPFQHTIGGCNVQFLKLESNFLFTNVVCCVFRVALRPHNPDKPKVIPGLYYLVRKWATLNSLPQALCNNATNSPQIDALKDVYGFYSKTQYTTYQGLAHGRPLIYPGAYSGLAALQNLMNNCDKQKAGNFMTKSEFLFNFEQLIACEKEKMMELTHKVVVAFCLSNVDSCSAAKTMMQTDCPNLKPNKQMAAFMENNCE